MSTCVFTILWAPGPQDHATRDQKQPRHHTPSTTPRAAVCTSPGTPPKCPKLNGVTHQHVYQHTKTHIHPMPLGQTVAAHGCTAAGCLCEHTQPTLQAHTHPSRPASASHSLQPCQPTTEARNRRRQTDTAPQRNSLAVQWAELGPRLQAPAATYMF